MTAVIVGPGTTEDRWQPWLEPDRLPELDITPAQGRRVVVLAAHPDDEVLGVGGLLTTLVTCQDGLVMIWATDGEASHPGSAVVDRDAMARRRRAESLAALDRLRITPDALHRLGLPDSGLAARFDALDAALAELVRPGDLVLAPWSGDGHPDHEAVGAAAGRHRDITLWQYPIWMWHWASPADPRVPWRRCRSWPTPDLDAKRSAIAEFTSQVQPLGDGPGEAAILPPQIVARFLRGVEVVIT